MRYDLTLMEILIRSLRKWRFIIVFALSGAILLTLFGVARSVVLLNTSDNTGSVADTSTSGTAEEDLRRIERQKKELQDYLDQSIFLQLNPFGFSRGNLVLCVKDVQTLDEVNLYSGNETLNRLTRLYGYHAKSQGLMQRITEELELPSGSIRLLQEIISVSYANGVIEVTVDHYDATTAADLLDRIEAYLLAQRGTLGAEIANHNVVLVDKAVSSFYSYDFILSQGNIISRAEDIMSGLDEKAMEIQESGNSEPLSLRSFLKNALKYFLFGGVAGVIISGGCSVLMILFSNKVIDEKDLLKRYRVKVLAVYRGKL